MNTPGPTNTRGGAGISRRAALALGAGTLVGTSGCVRRVRSLLNRDALRQVSLNVKTVPADADPRATRVARYLVENLRSVGIDGQVVPMDRESLYRDILVNHNFDLYVARFPSRGDPDFLRPLLHSEFGVESGWQNPFGYADLDVDLLLERQRRRVGRKRRQTVGELQRTIARAQPFTVIAFVDEIRAVRTDRIVGWANPHTPLGYLSLDPRGMSGSNAGGLNAGEASKESNQSSNIAPRRTDVRMAIADTRPLENLNPLAVSSRYEGVITGLLYDPLARHVDGQVRPWLAAGWQWRGNDTLDVRLRDGLQWHDGEPLTAPDVAFTYRLLQDTSLGQADSPIPAPRFRGPSSLVADVEALDDSRVRLKFKPSGQNLATRALNVPILPTHIWSEKTGTATVAGIDTGRGVTDALVWGNRNAIGSGPLRLGRLQVREQLELAPFDEHFLTHDLGAPYLEPYRGGFTPERLIFRRSPSGSASVGMVRAGDVEATATGVLAEEVPAIGRADDVKLRVDRSRSFYHLGYNSRRDPLGNPRFRRAVAQLLDKGYLVERIFGGYASPAASPLARHEWLTPELAWKGTDPELPFPGNGGTLDEERARSAFREAGYRYSDNGKLLTS